MDMMRSARSDNDAADISAAPHSVTTTSISLLSEVTGPVSPRTILLLPDGDVEGIAMMASPPSELLDARKKSP